MNKPVLLTISGLYGSYKERVFNAIANSSNYTELTGFCVDKDEPGYARISSENFTARMERGDIVQCSKFDDGIVGFRKQDIEDAVLTTNAVVMLSPSAVEELRDNTPEESAYRVFSVYVTGPTRLLNQRLETESPEKANELKGFNRRMNANQSAVRYNHEVMLVTDENLEEVILEILDRIEF